MFALIGLLSGLLFVVADIPYIRDTLSGKTKPHRTSWFLYFVFNSVSIANQAAIGATNSLWFPIAGATVTFIVFIASLKHGTGGYEKLDIVCLLGALVGIVLWVVFDNPMLSIVANLISTMFAVAPTIKKAYFKPESETAITYLIASVSAVLAAISVGKLDWILILLPMYSFTLQFGIYVLLTRRKLAK